MTSKEKFLAVYPMAQIWPPSTGGDVYRIVRFVGDTDYITDETPEAAWQNAAESLPAEPAPDPKCECTHLYSEHYPARSGNPGGCFRCHCSGFFVGEPLAPIETKEKNRLTYEETKKRFELPVAEPKPTPSVECNEQEFPGPIPSNCPKCGETIWGEGWNPNTGIRYFSHVPKPQPESSSVPDHIVNAHEMVDSSSISTEQTFEDVLRNRAGEYQDMGREHRKNEEYAAACTCEDKASGLYVAIKLYRIWNAAKGHSNGR